MKTKHMFGKKKKKGDGEIEVEEINAPTFNLLSQL